MRKGGWPQLGAIVAIMGVIDALFAPRLLKKVWDEQEVSEALLESRGRDPRGRWLGRQPRRPRLRNAGAGCAGGSDEALARAIADEWNASRARSIRATMPLTGLANAAVDRVAPDPEAFAAGLARYAEADLACYRAEGPRALVERQSRLGIRCLTGRGDASTSTSPTSGLIHVAAAARNGRPAQPCRRRRSIPSGWRGCRRW